MNSYHFWMDLRNVWFFFSDFVVPLPTFVVSPSSSATMKYVTDLDGCQICDNLTYLGQQGTYTTLSGLRVVYVSSNSDTGSRNGPWLSEFPALESDPTFTGVDLLLTCQWPKFIVNSKESLGVDVDELSSVAISHIALAVKPRYHFSATAGVFYERNPYRYFRTVFNDHYFLEIIAFYRKRKG